MENNMCANRGVKRITIFNRKLVATTFSMTQQSLMRERLTENGIDYYVKVINRKSGSPFGDTSRARTGTLNENILVEYEYLIYVHKNDYIKAKLICTL